MHTAAQAYLDLPANDRLETRLPRRLKADAEAVARAKGQTLSQWLLTAIAERVSADYAATLQWQLTPDETATLLRVLVAPGQATPALVAAGEEASRRFGPNPT